MPNLLFCMTPGVGLKDWKKNGSLKRELMTHIEYVKKGWNVRVLSFDKDELPELSKGIEMVRFPNRRFLWALPWICKDLGDWADVIKTNQSHHAYYYTNAAKVWKKPILLRCGYIHGEYLETTRGRTVRTRVYQALEAKAFRDATHCQVPTEELAKWLQNRYQILEKKISILPNFVDINIFKPLESVAKIDRSIILVGRLEPVKRYDLLIQACSLIPDCVVTIVGEGSEWKRLKELAKKLNVNCRFLGKVENERLPQLLNENQIFALTSAREGHPKALIEAMACGLTCLVTDSVGISNFVRHSQNAWVVEDTENSIKEGLCFLLDDKDLRLSLDHNAAGFVRENYVFENCFKLEYELLKMLLGG